jgi:predicted ATPase
MKALPQGTVTLLFTDIEGSTRLLHELGDSYAHVLAEHRRVLREAFGRHGGVEVDTQGDAFFYAFARAADAVAAAGDAQQALAAGPVRVRIGVHTGEPLVADEGYVGVDVHRAARIMAAGHGGQVLVSETTCRLVDARFPLHDLGPQRLKDMTEAQHLFQLGEGDFPPLKTLNQTNLPVAASPLLGRETELAELIDLVLDGARDVSVTGPGGSGKTRLALQAAADVVDRFEDGVFWVPLAGIGDAELVLPSVAQTLGARDDLGAHLASRRALLLLDNFEHVIGAAPQLAEVLTAAPNVRVLVTSRSPLHIGGEHEYVLDPLRKNAAVMLFVERARAAGANVEADGVVAAICERLDRLPLAVELAAARAKLLSPAVLLQRLDRRLPLLTSGRRDAPERQRTLRATIEWSVDLLDDAATRLLERLSVFAGPFSLEAAERVADADLDSLATLVDLNLLKPVGGDAFLMLETIREFAAERLDACGGSEVLRERHARHFLARSAALHESIELAHAEALDEIARDHDNLRLALAWFQHAREHDSALDLMLRIANFWTIQGHWLEGRRWFEQALVRRPQEPDARYAKALEWIGGFALRLHDLDSAATYWEEGLADFRALDDAGGAARALIGLGSTAGWRDDLDTAEKLWAQAADLARGSDARALAMASNNLGDLAIQRREYRQALAALDEAVAISREAECGEDMIVIPLLNRAVVLFLLDRVDEAAIAATEGLVRSHKIGDVESLTPAFALVGSITNRRGQFEIAAVLMGVARKLQDVAKVELRGVEAGLAGATLADLQRSLGKTRFAALMAEAETMTLDQAVEHALAAAG